MPIGAVIAEQYAPSADEFLLPTAICPREPRWSCRGIEAAIHSSHIEDDGSTMVPCSVISYLRLRYLSIGRPSCGGVLTFAGIRGL